MNPKTLIVPELKRVLSAPFAWVDRRLLFNGFLSQLTHSEILLYFFLVLAADRDGLSFYNYDKICHRLKLDIDNYVQARNGLIEKKLIAFDGHQFQVLTLPQVPKPQAPSRKAGITRDERDAQSLASILSRLAQSSDQNSATSCH